MTHKERMIAAVRGQPVDHIPWAPRMDLWYIANRERGTLPLSLQGLNAPQIAEHFGFSCHTVKADYTQSRSREDLLLRGIGLDNHPDYPFTFSLRGLDVDFRQDGPLMSTTIETPKGSVSMKIEFTEEMRRAGASIPFIRRYPIEDRNEIEALMCVFDHIEVSPAPEKYRTFYQRVGDKGLAVASGMVGASPMHLVLHNLMRMDEFFYLYIDDRPSIEELTAHIEPIYEKVLDSVLETEAEVMYWGANYDQSITYPDFFSQEISPWLEKVAKKAHEQGKLLLTHTDGENEQLLDNYRTASFDIAESVCTAPMTRNTLRELRDGLAGDLAIWGGIPSVALISDSMKDEEFESFVAKIFDELGEGRKLIFGVSDNVPPDADLDRIYYITKQIEDFGPV